jgi:hypothetical protein
VVLKEESNRVKKSSLGGSEGNETHYLNQLKFAPGLTGFLQDSKLTSEVKSAGDYSYSASHYAGPNYRIAGDAGG